MFDFIRRLFGMGGTAPAKSEAAVRDAAAEPWLTPQDREAAAALAAAGYAAPPGKDTGKPTAASPARKPSTPARGEYDRPAPEPVRTKTPPVQAQVPPSRGPLPPTS